MGLIFSISHFFFRVISCFIKQIARRSVEEIAWRFAKIAIWCSVEVTRCSAQLAAWGFVKGSIGIFAVDR